MSLNAGFQIRKSLLRPAGSCNSEFLAALFVIGNEEVFKLFEQSLAHIVYGSQVLVIVGMNSNA